MGCSCDWDRTRFTMDPVCARAVREAFFRLFKDGLIYRGKRLVNWDPATQTALADDEVEMEEIDGHFWYLRYPLVEPVEYQGQKIEHVTVATTRPETMLGDTAVAMNPADPRIGVLKGKKVRLPIVNRVVPIIADEYVVLPNPESDDAKAKFASGFLKVTPAHDPNDYDIWRRHEREGIGIINILAPDGSISEKHGWPEEDYRAGDAFLATLFGKDRFEARKMVVGFFKENGLLEEVKPYRHSVGHSYRSHVPVEPYLSDQWYCKVTDDRLAGRALRRWRRTSARHPRRPYGVRRLRRRFLRVPCQEPRAPRAATGMLPGKGNCASPRSAMPGRSRRGTRTSATGASAGNCGGGIGYRCGPWCLTRRTPTRSGSEMMYRSRGTGVSASKSCSHS